MNHKNQYPFFLALLSGTDGEHNHTLQVEALYLAFRERLMAELVAVNAANSGLINEFPLVSKEDSK